MTEVAFELERFGWSEPGRLEVVGRWSGIEGRRLGRPLLTAEVAGKPKRLTALPGGHLASGNWRATFACDADPAQVSGFTLEVARRLVVDLPAPKAYKPRPREVQALEEERARRTEAEATLAERDAELVSLREEADAALARSEAEVETLRARVEELEPAAAALTAAEAERDGLREELAAAQAEAAKAQEKLELERAVTVELREKIATAREETETTITAEAEETERLRAELQAAREKTERAVAAEQEETAKLREALAGNAAEGESEDADVAAKRMYERIARELESERAAARTLRRELDAVQQQTAEHRRAASSAAANGITEDVPAATPAGRLWASRQSDAGRAVAQHRADAARAAAAHRVPAHQRSAAAVWAVRVAALVFVVAFLLAGVLIASWVT